MKVSAVVTVLIASFIFLAGATLERASHEATAPAKPAASVAAPKMAPERISTVVTLPEVTVHPSAEDIALAFVPRAADAGTGAAPDFPMRLNAGVSRGSFDMPYYSFGKVLPQVSQD